MRFQYSLNPEWLERPIHIALVGAGGNGSEMLDILARMHLAVQAVGHPYGFRVTVWDGDDVSPSNVVRQRFWPTDIGQNKAMVLVERLNLWLGTQWDAVADHCSAAELAASEIDLVITCVDTAATRVAICRAFARHRRYPDEVLLLDLGNGENTGQFVLGHLDTGDRPGVRLPHVFDLYPELAGIVDDTTPSCSAEEALRLQTFGINKTLAVVAGNLLWALFTRPAIDYHGGYIDCRANRTQPLRIDTDQWASLGFHVPETWLPVKAGYA